MIDIRFITFMSLCETRNYTKTAELLYVTQPTVTHHIKSIEKSYDIKLFTSSTKNFQLTPEGELLYKYVLQLQAFDSQFERILKASEKEKEQLTFSVTNGVNNGFLKYILPKWTLDRIDIQYNLNITNTSDIIEELRLGLIDFAIVDSAFPKKIYSSVKVHSTKIVLAVNKKHPLAKNKIVHFDDLNEYRILTDKNGSSKRDFLENQLKLKNRSVRELDDIIEINCPKTCLEMVLNDNLAGFFYESEIENEVRSGKVISINIAELSDANSVNFMLIYNKNHLSVKLIEEIAKEFQQIYTELNYLKYISS